MIPLRDDQPRFSTPYVTYFLVVINLIIYYGEFVLSPRNQRALLYEFGLIPAHVAALATGASHAPAAAALLPIITSMFLHGSWAHVVGNMWYLWIFGDNIEDYLGHFKYLVFYLLCGITAALAQVALSPDSRLPTVGASGAIAGILGAYFLLYPKARVLIWLVLIFYVPAWVLLGFWFVMQFVSGTVSSAAGASGGGGIAFWAHVGGFIAGVLLIKLFPERPRRYRYGTW